MTASPRKRSLSVSEDFFFSAVSFPLRRSGRWCGEFPFDHFTPLNALILNKENGDPKRGTHLSIEQWIVIRFRTEGKKGCGGMISDRVLLDQHINIHIHEKKPVPYYDTGSFLPPYLPFTITHHYLKMKYGYPFPSPTPHIIVKPPKTARSRQKNSNCPNFGTLLVV